MDWYYISKITNIVYFYFTLIFSAASIVAILVTVFKRSSKASKKRKIIRTVSLVLANIFLLSFMIPFQSFAKVSKEATENFNQIDYNTIYSYAKDNGKDFSSYPYGDSCWLVIDGVDVVLHFDSRSELNSAKANTSYLCFDIWDKLFTIRRFTDDRGIIYMPTERESDMEEIPMNKYIQNDIYIFTNDGDIEVSYHTTTNKRGTLIIVSEALKQISEGKMV